MKIYFKIKRQVFCLPDIKLSFEEIVVSFVSVILYISFGDCGVRDGHVFYRTTPSQTYIRTSSPP